jgi:hypothetical protein
LSRISSKGIRFSGDSIKSCVGFFDLVDLTKNNTALDILDELLSIVLRIPKDQIMRKPVDKKEFTNTVNKLLN